MDWIIEAAPSDKVRHTAVCLSTAEDEVQAAVFTCADYAFSLLDESIEDNARYCLFAWDTIRSTLSITVTDETREQDGKHLVTVKFTGFDEHFSVDQVDDIKFCLTDYLTTSLPFLKFSLLAVFVREGQDKVELM
ncbi:MAG: hypothetical protein KUG80_03735 [Gammaproteobacteria bacterium]|nr:hypothetical protein [Gammaproteobacteria bacterium]